MVPAAGLGSGLMPPENKPFARVRSYRGHHLLLLGWGLSPLPRLPTATPPLPQYCFPSPGMYGPRGNPYARLEERDKHSASTRGLMDSRTAKCALLAAVASPAPSPEDMLVGWPHPPAEHSPCCLSPRACRAVAWNLAPTTCGAASTRGCGRWAALDPASSSWGTGRSPLVVAIMPWRYVALGPHTRTGFISELWHCQHIAIRMESCLAPASVLLGFCSSTSLRSWKNTPTQQHLGSERAASTMQESRLVPLSSSRAELS